MRFGKTLQQSQFGPWKEYYLDYQGLKALLREKDANDAPWTAAEEEHFADELVNTQLGKVNAFQAAVHKQLDEKLKHCQAILDDVSSSEQSAGRTDEAGLQHPQRAPLEDVYRQLDEISHDINELERFTRINYTGALKAAKKHDRRRGINYKVRPMVQVRLAALPFNSEDFSPLLRRLSAMYFFVRQRLGDTTQRSMSNQGLADSDGEYISHKFFIHSDSLLEVKTMILRHLPVLLYTPSAVKEIDGAQRDPSMTALYFDNPSFQLYTSKLDKGSGASSLRLRWYDHLSDNAEVIMEKKTLREGDDSEEVKIKIKDKYVMPFLNGGYNMEKAVRRLEAQKGDGCAEARQLQANAAEIHDFVRKNELQPMLRANFTRTAFQIPGEDRLRISIDTNLTHIREDCLDSEQPCRDPNEWHRRDIDDSKAEFPFPSISGADKSEFPYAIMEIKILRALQKKKIEWIEDLMNSHLVKEAPRFSKFLHGVASLFEDYINSIPFWMSLSEMDIRRDPQEAFQEEQDKKARQAEDEFAVGSLLGSATKARSPNFEPAVKSPVAKAQSESEASASKAGDALPKATMRDDDQGDSIGRDGLESSQTSRTARLRGFLPSFSNSKYAHSRRIRSQLPPGVKKPDYFLKDAGEIKVEPKVWLANQRSVSFIAVFMNNLSNGNALCRTFIKYQHVSVLLAVLALGLFNAAGPNNTVATALAVVYTLIAVFIGKCLTVRFRPQAMLTYLQQQYGAGQCTPTAAA